jgi:disulfide oxidoreductase YuzD
MNKKRVVVTVYGAEQICASCVGAPGSKDTYEWLQAAIGRKYNDRQVQYEYIDINNPPKGEEHAQLVGQLMEEELFYPLIIINGGIVAEGIPSLKPIYKELEKSGITLKAE